MRIMNDVSVLLRDIKVFIDDIRILAVAVGETVRFSVFGGGAKKS